MNPAPPKLSPADSRRTAQWLGMAIGGVMAAGACATLYFFNPSQYHIYPVCTFHQLTGLYCPGCGATRALYALLHGDFLTALHDNALFIALLVASAGRGAWLAVEKLRGRVVGGFMPVAALWAVLVVALVFSVVRNLPAFACLAPL